MIRTIDSQRIRWVDICRGIGIIFVIYAHALGDHTYGYLFYAFHIPLFFFLSGMLFGDTDSLWKLFKKSIKGLLVPYLLFAGFSYCLWALPLIIHHRAFFQEEILREFFGIFYGNSNYGLMTFNDVLWFLPTLFVTKMLFGGIRKKVTSSRLLIPVLAGFSIAGYLFSLILPTIKLPFGAEVALSAVVFYGIGFVWFYSKKAKEIVIRYAWILFPLLVAVSAIFATIDYHIYQRAIDMRLDWLNNYFLFYLAAFSGIFAWIGCSIILKKNIVLELIGKKSLLLFALHPIVFLYLGELFKNRLPLSITTLTPAIYTILSIGILLWCSFVYTYATEKIKYILRVD